MLTTTCRCRTLASTSFPREGFPVFMGTQVRAVKWYEWKLRYAWQDEPTLPPQPSMKLFNLHSDPKEETDVKDLNP